MSKSTDVHGGLFEALANDRAARREVTKQSHLMFFHIYFSKYVKYPIAEFQKEIFRVTEDTQNKLAIIVAFRGSGKSTLVTFSYALWSILGVQEKKFVLIICQTQAQARQHMQNIKHELEDNKLLRSDMGPFQEEKGGEQWAISSLVFSNTGARIMVASVDQSIRGIRHHEHRPDLIILDDIEDMASTKTMEGRGKIFEWFTREIVPLGDIGTRILMVGNLLHEDALVMRLKKMIDRGELKGIYHWFPLLDELGECAWPGKFDAPEKIEDLRKSVANELAWRQEYLLEIISDSTRVIFPEWIRTYSTLPKERATRIIIGVDLAIKEAMTADYTAMVVLNVYGYGENATAYVLPNPVRKRMSFPDVVETADNLNTSLRSTSRLHPKFVVESNGFQEIYVNAFAEAECEVAGVKITTDKRSRLALTSHHVRIGKILFPENGAETLIAEITGFGIENHDDLVDAFSVGAAEFLQLANKPTPRFTWMNSRSSSANAPRHIWDDDENELVIDTRHLRGR